VGIATELASGDGRNHIKIDPEGTEMRLNRGDRIAGVDGVQLRNYFRRFGSAYVNYATVMKEFCPQIEVFSILKNRSRTISFCEWKSLFEMEGFRYGVVFGEKKRIVGLLTGGQLVESAENAKG
jgi:hypothetical protein